MDFAGFDRPLQRFAVHPRKRQYTSAGRFLRDRRHEPVLRPVYLVKPIVRHIVCERSRETVLRQTPCYSVREVCPSATVFPSISQSHFDAARRHKLLGLPDGVFTVVKNARCQHCVSVALQDSFHQMMQITYATACDYWYIYRI